MPHPSHDLRNPSHAHNGNMTPDNHSAFADGQVQQLVADSTATPSADRYYQIEAVNAVDNGYTAVDRGQLHMACGTGKTRVYMRVVARECPGGLVVVLAPSVWLLGQIIKDWRASFGLDHVAMAVCHDSTVADDPEGYDLAVPVTTSQREVAEWLTGHRSAGVTRLVVATHRSARVVGAALHRVGLAADLLIVDEAHHSAGRADKYVAFVHDNTLFPAVRRLYGTATPVQFAESSSRAATVHMDDEMSFGPVFYTYPLDRAIADTYLDDYRLVVVGVSDREARRLLTRRRATPAGKDSPIDLHTAMCQIVLAKTAAQFDLRRVIVFDRSVDDAIHFAETLPATVAMMGEGRPERPLTSSFVYGEMKIRERNRELDLLREPPEDGWVSLSNMRCLGEGIDVPAVDGVMFTYPKQSPVEIVQAVGRATRRNPSGSGTSTIILPIAVPDTPDNNIDQDSLTVGRYRVLWDVLRGLRQHDAMLSREIDRLSAGGGKPGVARPPGGKIEVHLPKGWKPMEFLQQLAVRVVATTRSVWWDGMEALRQFHAEHGHTDVVAGTLVKDVDLFQWSATNRDTYKRGKMPEDRDAALRAVGFDPETDAVSWAKGFHASCAFRDRYGHLEAPEGLIIDGVHVRAWQDQQRDLHAEGVLSSLRWRRLEAIGMRWTSRPHTAQEYLDAVTAYYQRNGHINIAADAVSDDGYLGQWLVEQQLAFRKGVLEDWVRQRLDEMGMDWDRAPKPVRRFALQDAP